MIRKIHQIWIQGAEHFQQTQPEFYQYSLKWKLLFPDFTYKLWSEADFLPLLEQFDSRLLTIYQKAPTYAGKSDISRYVILHLEGGLYADTDYEPFKNCSYLFEGMNMCVVAMALSKNKLLFADVRYNTAWIYSVPNLPFWKEMLISFHEYDPKKESKFDYTWSTGPKTFAKLITEKDLVHDPLVRILPHPMIECADFSNVAITKYNEAEILQRFPYAVGIHRCAGSWIQNIGTVKLVFGEFYTWLSDWSEMVHIGMASLLLLIPIVLFSIWLHRRRQKTITH
jgi:mannosyltransferase OCH1-like enzyme